jgi:PAS domain S-box-containing protein
MKSNRKTKIELIKELESVRRKVKKMETLQEKHRHTQQNITERKHVDEELRFENEILAHIVESVHLVRVDDGAIVYTNQRFDSMFGYHPGELVGKHVSIINAPGEKTPEAVANEIIRSLKQAGGVWSGEVHNIRKDGYSFWCYANVSRFKHPQYGEVWISVNRDITERKKTDEEISKSHEELRMLANHLQNIREEERNHLAREFHDQLGQSMTAIKMDLSFLLRTISDEKKDVQRKLIVEELQSMQKLVDETSQLVWTIIMELRPQMLDDLGLVATFEWEAQQFESRTGISCEFKSSAGDIQMDSKKSIALYRIYQEALTNIAHHAKATVVKSVLRRDKEVLVLEIKDNGCGITFDKQSKPKSFGLIGMRERAMALGGQLEISGIAGEGTTIIVRLPLSVSGGIS